MEKLIIKKNDLSRWLGSIIGSGAQVLAPVTEDGRTDFRTIASPEETATPDSYVQTVQSAKKTVFPKAETLFRYRREGKDTTLEEPAADSVPQTVVWQARPCDAAGLAPLTGIFNWDYKDTQYNARLANLTLVAFSCTSADVSCFCTSVGGGPGSTQGCDALVTMLQGDDALVEVMTDKGKALTALSAGLFAPAGDLDKEAALADLPARFTKEQIREKLDRAFDDPVWAQQSKHCLGCGACAFVCPTCACFDIQEDAHGALGRRIRCWDSCGLSLFTLHTSGHNPRPTQGTRWRQRILHKFSYMPERIAQTGCTGCGRCSRACPVDMNILEHLTSIANQNHG